MLGQPSYRAVLDEAWAQHLEPRAEDAPSVVSTFAGCGGSSLGYSMAGYRERLAVEWDDNAVATFKANFPHVPVYHGDIAKLSVQQCLDLAKIQPRQLDVFDGSPPCQGFSTAGKRIFGDDRNGLFREFVRLLRGLQPRAFVMENVSGMVKGKMRLAFVEILRELKASGYRVVARLLNAKYFWVPQSRERLIFVGVREDLGIEPSHPRPECGCISSRHAIGRFEGMYPDETGRHKPHIREQWSTGYNPRNGRAGLRVVRAGAYVGSFNSCRLEAGKPSPTFVKSHNHWHYSEFRHLAPVEASILASFGENFVWRSDFVERIGNSVPPLFMRSIARHIRAEILDRAGPGALP